MDVARAAGLCEVRVCVLVCLFCLVNQCCNAFLHGSCSLQCTSSQLPRRVHTVHLTPIPGIPRQQPPYWYRESALSNACKSLEAGGIHN